MSSLILASHVKEGLELARQNRLPARHQWDFIQQASWDRPHGFFSFRKPSPSEAIPPLMNSRVRIFGPETTDEGVPVSSCWPIAVHAAVTSLKEKDRTTGSDQRLVNTIFENKFKRRFN